LSINDDNAASRAGRFADYYSFSVDASRQVQIDLTSNGGIDPFLYLHDGCSSSSIVTSDDDSGGSLNSRITITLSPGVYSIEVTSYSSNDTGSYSLSLQ
jgi:hypothetical protein